MASTAFPFQRTAGKSMRADWGAASTDSYRHDGHAASALTRPLDDHFGARAEPPVAQGFFLRYAKNGSPEETRAPRRIPTCTPTRRPIGTTWAGVASNADRAPRPRCSWTPWTSSCRSTPNSAGRPPSTTAGRAGRSRRLPATRTYMFRVVVACSPKTSVRSTLSALLPASFSSSARPVRAKSMSGTPSA